MHQQRKHIRLREFDYSSDGYYFITICTNNKEHFFGTVNNGSMDLNQLGKFAEKELRNIENHFSFAGLDEFIVMPNHIHCIIILDNPKPVGTSLVMSDKDPIVNKFSKPKSDSISFIIQQFKASVKRWCNKNNYGKFSWQSRFYDRVIRNNEEYKYIQQYIKDNPPNWIKDEFFENK